MDARSTGNDPSLVVGEDWPGKRREGGSGSRKQRVREGREVKRTVAEFRRKAGKHVDVEWM